MKKRMIYCLMTLMVLAWNQNISAISAEETTDMMSSDQISPIIDKDGADPFVTRYNDQYLYTKTTGSDISIGIVDTIQTLGAAEMKKIYKAGDDMKDLWAPEIWHLDDAWYVYFAAVHPGEEMHHMFVLKNTSADPLEGTWECEELAGMDDKFAIDGTIMELNDKRYFVWSGWEGYKNVRQDIYLAEMVSPTEVKEEKILLSIPEYDWELHGEPMINEGPEIVVQDNTVNLVYSASGSWTDDYCLGLLTMDIQQDPKEPTNWKKQETPILAKNQDVYGPGHNSFTISKDGTENLNIYHAARWQGAGWNRSVRFGTYSFDENGRILPMEVTSGEELITIPSGEDPVTVYSATDFAVSGKVFYDEEKDCITKFSTAKDEAEFILNSECEEEVIACAIARVNKKTAGVAATLAMQIGEETEVQEVFAGENYQPLYFHITLQPGENRIKLFSSSGGGKLEIRQVEIRR